jgi:formate dehydrogenase assembly factor FdhD
MDLTLIGFLRGERFVIYSGADRISLAMPEG